MSEATSLSEETIADAEADPQGKKKRPLLSFRPSGESIGLADVGEFFAKLSQECTVPITAEKMATVGQYSGTHFLKLRTPRAHAEQNVLRLAKHSQNEAPPMFPSVNAADIPIAKVAYTPIEVEGYEAKSVVSHLLQADEVSSQVLSAFAAVFGDDVLEALRNTLAAEVTPITRLPTSEFPIVFLPNPAGGDLQATPLASVQSMIKMGEVRAPYFQKQVAKAPAVPRGNWSVQYLTSKPQNISGAIGPRRFRFMASFPDSMSQFDAEMYRFMAGGRFPLLRNTKIVEDVLKYAELLEVYHKVNQLAVEAACDRRADRLIKQATEFVDEIRSEVRRVGGDPEKGTYPSVVSVLMRRSWKDQEFTRARIALTGSHFTRRVARMEKMS